jgi:hypothetical protein
LKKTSPYRTFENFAPGHETIRLYCFERGREREIKNVEEKRELKSEREGGTKEEERGILRKKVCVCVCVCESEREREREGSR